MEKITSNSNEIEEVFLYYSLCYLLSNVSFCASDNECDDTNENVKFSKTQSTSTITSQSNVIRDENVASITKDFNNSTISNLTKIQHKPLVIHLNSQKESNAMSIMDKKNEHLFTYPLTLVTSHDDSFNQGYDPKIMKN